VLDGAREIVTLKPLMSREPKRLCMEGSFDGLSLKTTHPPLVERKITLPLDDSTKYGKNFKPPPANFNRNPRTLESSTSSSGGPLFHEICTYLRSLSRLIELQNT